MCATAGKIHQALVVVGIGDAKLHPVRVRGGVQQPQTRMGRRAGHLDDALNGAGAAFDHSTHALFFNGGQAACKVAGADRILTHAAAVFQRFIIGIAQLFCGLLRSSALEQQVIQTNGLDDLLKDGRAALIRQPVVEPAHDHIASQTAGVVTAAALCADDQILHRHIHAGGVFQLFQGILHPVHALADGRLCAALVLDEHPAGGLALFLGDLRQPLRLHILAAQTHRQHCAHIGVTDEADEQVDGILVIGAAVKAQQLHVGVVAFCHDLLRHKLGTLDRVDHQHPVPDALAAVFAGVAEPGEALQFIPIH